MEEAFSNRSFLLPHSASTIGFLFQFLLPCLLLLLLSAFARFWWSCFEFLWL
jgi:hypothetical protein